MCASWRSTGSKILIVQTNNLKDNQTHFNGIYRTPQSVYVHEQAIHVLKIISLKGKQVLFNRSWFSCYLTVTAVDHSEDILISIF